MIKVNELLTKTQADGAQAVTLGIFDEAKLHQIQVSVSATPAAGTLTVAVRTPVNTASAAAYGTLPWTIDLTALATNSIFQFVGFASAIQITPSGFDGDKTYSVVICTGDRGGGY